MGWTCLEQRYSNFDFSTAKGRKAYLDSEFTNEYLQVLSSSLMGNVYYAATQRSTVKEVIIIKGMFLV